MMNDYVAQKLRELDEDRLNRTLIVARMQEASLDARRKSKPVIGPALRVAGRTLRRVGEGLEGWAAPASTDGERSLSARRPPG